DSMLVGMMRTHSANSEVTDSAAAGTAMATGEKTNNGMISTSPEGEKRDTILEAAEERKLSTGLVATSTITHATPAVFASHVRSDCMLVGMMRTHSANSEVTDSAAAGTAMATGEKTNNGMISTSPEGEKLDTILEAAEERKLSTGLVATSTITHATPAVFASHV